jgi:hypothetical protein
MPANPQHTFSPSTAFLTPLYPNDGARMMNVRLSAGTYTRGLVLGEVTATPGIYGIYADAGAGGLDTARLTARPRSPASTGRRRWACPPTSVAAPSSRRTS